MIGTYVIAIHGGAGTIDPKLMNPVLMKEYQSALTSALKAAEKVLAANKSAIDAVQAAVVSLEDCPLFNAGKGSVFTNEGTHEMDAAIMDGATLNAGSVCGVSGVANPVLLSRLVMDKSDHVMLSGDNALKFGKQMNIITQDPDYFYTDLRYQQWQAIKDKEIYTLDHSNTEVKNKNLGTVGAVALDMKGNIAAATSTGGMTNKRWGRIGDSPVIGAGTYANNDTCAISCTGHGEYFLRAVAAYDVSCLMEYRGMSLKEACRKVIMDKMLKLGGEGGLVACDRHGNSTLIFNSEGMYRGLLEKGEEMKIGIYKDWI